MAGMAVQQCIVLYVLPSLKPHISALLNASEAEQARRRGLFSRVKFGIFRNNISRQTLNYGACGMEQKVVIFHHIIDVRDELAIRLLDGKFLKFSTKHIY